MNSIAVYFYVLINLIFVYQIYHFHNVSHDVRYYYVDLNELDVTVTCEDRLRSSLKKKMMQSSVRLTCQRFSSFIISRNINNNTSCFCNICNILTNMFFTPSLRIKICTHFMIFIINPSNSTKIR